MDASLDRRSRLAAAISRSISRMVNLSVPFLTDWARNSADIFDSGADAANWSRSDFEILRILVLRHPKPAAPEEAPVFFYLAD